MGLWDRIRGIGKDGYRARAARKLESAGDLAKAIGVYLEAALPDEAARVILLRADAEPSLEKRVALFEHAAATAVDPDLVKKARSRRARLSYDLVRSHGTLAKSELLRAAEELEAAGEHELAAEAYQKLGDAEGEVRALTAAGAIERLEERLRTDAATSKKAQDLALALRRATDLDRGGERRAALAVLARALAGGPDERLDDLVRVVRHRLIRGPTATFLFDGDPVSVALGDRVTLGRGDATIVVASRSVSREHVAIGRDREGRAQIEDLGTRNGTFLAGARLAAPVPIGDGVTVTLGADLPCVVTPRAEGGVEIEVAGERFVAPLGPLRCFGWTITREIDDGEAYVVLSSGPDAAAYLGDLVASGRIDLAAGDAIAVSRGGPAVLKVEAPRT